MGTTYKYYKARSVLPCDPRLRVHHDSSPEIRKRQFLRWEDSGLLHNTICAEVAPSLGPPQGADSLTHHCGTASSPC